MAALSFPYSHSIQEKSGLQSWMNGEVVTGVSIYQLWTSPNSTMYMLYQILYNIL